MVGWLMAIMRAFGRGTRGVSADSTNDPSMTNEENFEQTASDQDHAPDRSAASVARPSSQDGELSAPIPEQERTLFFCTAETFIKARPIHSVELPMTQKMTASQGMIIVGRLLNEEYGHLRLEQVHVGESNLSDGPWFIYKPHWKEMRDGIRLP